MAKIFEVELESLFFENRKSLKFLLASSRRSRNTAGSGQRPTKPGCLEKAPDTPAWGGGEGQSRKELKERGLWFPRPIPPAANLSPNEEAAGSSELAGSSLTAN